MLPVSDDQRALAVALGLDELEPGAGWIDRDERDGSVIVLTRGNGALPSAEIEEGVGALVLDFEATQHTAAVVIGEL